MIQIPSLVLNLKNTTTNTLYIYIYIKVRYFLAASNFNSHISERDISRRCKRKHASMKCVTKLKAFSYCYCYFLFFLLVMSIYYHRPCVHLFDILIFSKCSLRLYSTHYFFISQLRVSYDI